MKTNKLKGFTLIELLVVIAIIAILAAILFPVFNRARQQAYTATCSQNLNQIGKAFRLYVDEYGTWMTTMSFPHRWGAPPFFGYQGWAELLFKYHRKTDVYACPSRNVNFGYSFNELIQEGQGDITTKARNASRVIVAFDAPGSGNKRRFPVDPQKENGWETGDTCLSNGNPGFSNLYQESRNATGKQIKPIFDNDPIHKRAWAPEIVIGNQFPPVKSPKDTSRTPNDNVAFSAWLYYPGAHNGGNNILFLDGSVRFYNFKSMGDWDKANIRFTPY